MAAFIAAALVLGAILPFAGGASAATVGLDVQLPLGHQIRGVITSPDGDPVADTQVDASEGDTSVSAATGPDGSYVIHAVPDGSYRIHAADDASLFAGAYYGVPDSTPLFDDATLVEIAGADAAGIDIRLGTTDPPAPTGISGMVRDPDGQPVAGVDIQASGEFGFGTASTDATGSYRVPGLGAGDYQLFVQPPDTSDFLAGPYVDGAAGAPEEDGTPVTVADVDTTGIDVVLAHGRTITGHVSSARLAAIEVGAFGPGTGSAIVDGSGNFSIHGLAPGGYTLIFRDTIPGPEQTETGTFPYGYYGPGGSVVGQADAATVDVTAVDAAIHSVSIPRGTDITGQVTDGKKGLAGAQVEVCDVAGVLGCGFTDGASDGSFRVLHVPSGSFTIAVTVPDRVSGFYQPNGFTIDDFGATPVKVVSGGPDVKGIKVAVPLGGSISGRITGSSGEPLAGVFASAFPLGIAPNFASHLTGADGTFSQTGIPTNEYGLSVRAPVGSDYVSGYYAVGQPGNFTSEFEQATTFRVVEGGDHTAPTITFRDPAAAAIDVPTDAQLSVRLSEPVDGVTSSTFQLRDGKGKLVAASVSYRAIERTARLTPTDPLLPGTKYKLTLTGGVADWSGNRFAGASWSFTTAP
jgi:hypothetical protein